MKNGATSVEALRIERRTRRIAAGTGSICHGCDKPMDPKEIGCIYENRWYCESCVSTESRYHNDPEYNERWLQGYSECIWCGTHFSRGFYLGRKRSCSEYCSLRQTRNGGVTYYDWTDPNEALKELCKHCGDLFVPKRKSAKYCGGTCRQRARRSSEVWQVWKEETSSMCPFTGKPDITPARCWGKYSSKDGAVKARQYYIDEMKSDYEEGFDMEQSYRAQFLSVRLAPEEPAVAEAQ